MATKWVKNELTDDFSELRRDPGRAVRESGKTYQFFNRGESKDFTEVLECPCAG